MRTIKELLQILLDNTQMINEHDDGLCLVADELVIRHMLTNENCQRVKNYIHNNMRILPDGYGFPPGEIEPRKEWLNEHISKN